MINIKDLTFDTSVFNGEYLLAGINPVNEWKNDLRTDTIIGYSYTVALPALAYEKLNIKVMGKQMLSEADIGKRVKFTDLLAKPYQRNDTKEYHVTAKASHVALA